MGFFTSYVGSIVDRDVADVARVQDPTVVGTLLGLVAARSGALARYETLPRGAALDGKTVKSHLDI
jgi:predicted AAA+ superfamily ATPase